MKHVAITHEIQIAECALRDRGCSAGACDSHIERETLKPLGIFERQAIGPAPVALCQRLADAHHDALGARGGDGIHAQLEVVALRDLEQSGVDASARNVLEHRLAERLFNRHRLAQAAVHVHRKAGDALPVEQRKLQLAFENAMVRVVERHLDFGERQSAAQFDPLAHRLKRNGTFGTRGNYELRTHPALRRGNLR